MPNVEYPQLSKGINFKSVFLHSCSHNLAKKTFKVKLFKMLKILSYILNTSHGGVQVFFYYFYQNFIHADLKLVDFLSQPASPGFLLDRSFLLRASKNTRKKYFFHYDSSSCSINGVSKLFLSFKVPIANLII